MVLNRRNCSLVGKLLAATLAGGTLLEGAGACALSGSVAKSKNGSRTVLESKLAIYEEYRATAKTKIFRRPTHPGANISSRSCRRRNFSNLRIACSSHRAGVYFGCANGYPAKRQCWRGLYQSRFFRRLTVDLNLQHTRRSAPWRPHRNSAQPDNPRLGVVFCDIGIPSEFLI
jgi:hypothetical protein